VFRLSIVITACRDEIALESTLLSVLENRPSGCEVLVVCDAHYQDPYGLHDEVHFVRLLAKNQRVVGWHEMANRGLDASQGEIIHLLQPGILVEEGWVDSAIELLNYEADVAAVSPLVFFSGQAVPVAGVLVGRGGRRLEIRHGSAADQEVAGFTPPGIAGFYRRSSLRAVGGWDTQMAAEMADAELGCALALHGQRCKVARLCQVKSADDGVVTKATGFAIGLASELIVRRYDSLREQRLGSSAVLDTLRELPNLKSFAYFLGRMAGRFKSARRTTTFCRGSERFALSGPKSRAA